MCLTEKDPKIDKRNIANFPNAKYNEEKKTRDGNSDSKKAQSFTHVRKDSSQKNGCVNTNKDLSLE